MFAHNMCRCGSGRPAYSTAAAWLLPQVMHRDLLNANVLKAQYAVRGELYLKAEELRKQGRKIIATNSECSSGPRSCVAAAQQLMFLLTPHVAVQLATHKLWARSR
jgi:hypothetical protein